MKWYTIGHHPYGAATQGESGTRGKGKRISETSEKPEGKNQDKWEEQIQTVYGRKKETRGHG